MRDFRTMWGWRTALAVMAAATLGACIAGDDDAAAAASGDVEAEGWTPIAGEVRGVPVADVQAAIRARLDRGDARPASVTEREWGRVQELYGAYGASPLFLEADGLATRARAVIAAIADAHADALDPTRYPVVELQRAVAGVDARNPTADQLAAADLQLTAAYVAYAEDMLTGQLDPRRFSGIDDTTFVSALCQMLELPPAEKQGLLEADGPMARCEHLVALLQFRIAELGGGLPGPSGVVH